MRFVAALLTACCLLFAGGTRTSEARGYKPSQIDVAPPTTVTPARRTATPDVRPHLVAVVVAAPAVQEPPRVATQRRIDRPVARIECASPAVSSRGPPCL